MNTMHKNAYPLPSLDEMYASLCQHGDLFPADDTYEPPSLEGIQYTHPTKGVRDVRIDKRVLTNTEYVYANGKELTDALYAHGANLVLPLGKIVEILDNYLDSSKEDDGLVLGTVGFAAVHEGSLYNDEAEAIATIYDYLDEMNSKPVLTTDGASRPVVLGLNGVIAQQRGIATLGCAPLQGLHIIAPRKHLIVAGDTYEDREKIVGTLPDAVLCAGGAAGSGRECEVSLGYGSPVLLLMLKQYGPTLLSSTYKQSEVMQDALRNGQLKVCESSRDIPESVDWLINAVARTKNVSREARRQKVGEFILPQTMAS